MPSVIHAAKKRWRWRRWVVREKILTYTVRAKPADAVIVCYSGETAQALRAAELAGQQGLWVDVCKMCVIHPLPGGLVDALAGYRTILFAEEGIAAGGIGEHLCAALLCRGWHGHWRHVAVPNTGIDHATVPQLRQALGWMRWGCCRC